MGTRLNQRDGIDLWGHAMGGGGGGGGRTMGAHDTG